MATAGARVLRRGNPLVWKERRSAGLTGQHTSTARSQGRGVLLVVCSKDERGRARVVALLSAHTLEHRQDRRPRFEALAAFVANWESKSANTRRIAKQLDLEVDSPVVLDDNPAERKVVRRELCEADVLDLPLDPAGYLRCACLIHGVRDRHSDPRGRRSHRPVEPVHSAPLDRSAQEARSVARCGHVSRDRCV